MKKWIIENKFQINSKSQINKIIKLLLENRKVKTKNEIQEFLNPKLEAVTAKNVGIDSKQLQKAVQRVQKAIREKEQIIVFGDYDVDGICGTAILWESLNNIGANVLPYIPHRIDEGYGLSVKGIENVILSIAKDPVQKKDSSATPQNDKVGLIITVDNGIVANTAVEFAKKQGIDVIITDHHLPSKKLPKALAIVHTTKVCGAGVAWALAQEIRNSNIEILNKSEIQNSKFQKNDHLALVALATIADLVPLLGFNRTLVKFGLEELRETKRIGLLELFKEAVLNQLDIGVYEIGHIIAPRLNAMGRMEYAMDSLRLLCTSSKERARMLAEKLGQTNRERQELTMETTNHAKEGIRNQESGIRKLIFISHESYQPGVIGLVAGRLVEEFYRPAIVISKGEKYSKASARSVRGFNIIEFIREASEFLIDAGGHPMAAGFTVKTEKLELLQKTLEDLAEKLLDDGKLVRTLRVDCELPLSIISSELYDAIQKLAPFGMGNPEPTFVSRGVTVDDLRLVGREKNHVKFHFSCHPERSEGSKDSSPAKGGIQNDIRIFGIGFGLAEKAVNVHDGDSVDIAYTIDKDSWNGNQRLQLKIKDLKKI